MPESRLTLFYGDRELIPVRAIPFVTGWDISPDGVAKDLARRGLPVFSRLKSIHAYHLVDGKPVPILPKEWDAAVCGMEALEAELRFQFKDNRRGYQAWRQRSPSVLPAGVFVWQDEFESGYFDELRREWERLGGNRPGDDQINYMPMLSSELRDAVFEGFNLPGRELAELYKEQDARWRAAGRCTLEEVSLVACTN